MGFPFSKGVVFDIGTEGFINLIHIAN